MSRPNYRVVLSFDGERKVFIARIPELAHCSAEGATRGEAINRVEEELDAILHNLAERGSRPPSALDDTDHELTGELKVKVSAGLQRELTWQSHTEGVDLNQLAAELLASGLEQRRQTGRGPRRHSGNDNIGNSINHESPRGRGDGDRNRGGHAARFHDMLEDRAAFVDYVRKLESDGGRPPGRPHSDGRPRSDGRPQGQGDLRSHGPGQGGHGGPGQGDRGGMGRRPGREGNRGGGPRRGPEGREPGGQGQGPAAPRPHSPSESES